LPFDHFFFPDFLPHFKIIAVGEAESGSGEGIRLTAASPRSLEG
jgi:hypothetical protein